jgi:3-oxoacyl-[acyl-carrier protein] reductase
VDVTDSAALERLPGEVVARHGRLDIVVSNAGITRDQLLMRMKREDWDAVLATNLTAAFTLAQAAMRPMLKQRGARIVAISSVVGQMGNAGQTNYAASKAGLIGFSKALAREVASRGITVNVVAPGWFDSPLANGWKQDPELADGILGHTAQRRWGAPTDFAGAYQFLASDASAFVTGTVLSVDGGYLLV